MARSARMTIVEAEHIVPIGELDPMQIHVPGIFVNRIVQATTPKEIEIETIRPEPGDDAKAASTLGSGEARRKREMIVKVSWPTGQKHFPFLCLRGSFSVSFFVIS